MTGAKNNDPWQPLRVVKDYREFLKTYLYVRSISLSDLARASGYGRGFPGDVISGKRRVSGRSCLAFERGMEHLPAKGKKLFRMLVARDEPDVFPELPKEKVEKTIAQLRRVTWSGARRKTGHEDSVCEIFRSPDSALIYAAAGSPDCGATLQDLMSRTGLSEARIKTILQKMIRAGVIDFDEEERIYTPKDLHLFIQTSQQKDEMLLLLFTQACKLAESRISSAIDSDQEFFFTSKICVTKRDLPALKEQLREIVLQFVDDAICPNGEEMVSFVTALHR